MVNFWGILVVFAVCAAFQLAMSQNQNDHRPNLEDTSVSYPEEMQDGTPSATTPKIRLSLSERREALNQFAKNLLNEYDKNYVSKTRDVFKKLILELEALTEKSDDVKEILTDLKATLTKLEAFDIESDDLKKASHIISDLWDKLRGPVNKPLEVVAALRKVGWTDVDNELSAQRLAITHKFVIAFNHFVATLTPWERLKEARLIDLNKRFNSDRLYLFSCLGIYFK
ncbi:uncharacterized protein LOC120767255 isoform X2 [Bactrocera tryoni]|uniref:uncharacterized protein LOC120767255 isoform X2 n=2 Tax=Bactrocera tryoni TaxID=59916 RepID=UPI001A96A280|nr:uncharacterized protein LOC120767255 isoform X2 [Bactrocera tryoni]